MKTRSIISAFAIAALLLAGVTVVSVAANGGPVLLGMKNSATKPTGIKSSNGPALALKTKPTAPPLKVSSATKVTKLNADLVDGLDGARLLNAPRVFLAPPMPATVGPETFAYPLSLPNGKYMISWQISITLTAGAAQVDCYILRNHPPLGGPFGPEDRFFAGSTLTNATLGLVVVNSTGYVEKLPGTTLRFECTVGDDFAGDPAQPTQVIVTKADGGTTGALPPVTFPRPGPTAGR